MRNDRTSRTSCFFVLRRCIPVEINQQASKTGIQLTLFLSSFHVPLYQLLRPVWLWRSWSSLHNYPIIVHICCGQCNDCGRCLGRTLSNGSLPLLFLLFDWVCLPGRSPCGVESCWLFEYGQFLSPLEYWHGRLCRFLRRAHGRWYHGIDFHISPWIQTWTILWFANRRAAGSTQTHARTFRLVANVGKLYPLVWLVWIQSR